MTDPITSLTEAFGDSVLTDPHAMEPHLTSWFRDRTGAALCVLRPRDTAEVRRMVRACADLGLSIVPQGGNTGLVDGALPDAGATQVCLSLGRMNRMRSIDADDYSATVDAGCTLQAVKDAVAERDLFLPVSIGSQGTSQIGGVISTNAGGINVLRYGMMRDQVLGLEVVLPDGSLWDGLSTLRKNNTGPDIKQLFIGAEGTFGIVTAAALRLVPHPTAKAAALVAMPGLDATLATFHLARRASSDLLSAFEFLMPPALAIAREVQADTPELGDAESVYALIELAAPGQVDLDALLQGFLEQAMECGHVTDGVVASSSAQSERLWAIRESVNEGQAKRGAFMRSDVSVPLSDLPAFVREACAAIQTATPGAIALAYGHFGDGNVHLNVLPPEGADAATTEEVFERSKDLLNGFVDAFHGSISAEHGIGRLKRDDFHARLSGPADTLLARLKSAIDPDGRMNPGSLHR